jgi:hypothetical protein
MREWWVPIVAVPNRMRAAALVRSVIDSDMKVLYEGVEKEARLDTEHEPDAHEDDTPDCMYVGRAWHFTTEERW